MNSDIVTDAVYILLIALFVFGIGTAITGNPLPILAGVIVGLAVIALALAIATMANWRIRP